MTSWQLEAEAPLGRQMAVRRYRLHNGLGLIASVDRRAPIVAVQTWFGVGSRNERPGATGLAHLFEHLMFGQTEQHGPGEFDRLVERTGGESNAATWVDWTYYRLTVPSRDLALALDLEAQRMTKLVLADGPVEAEREVVINERRERVEDDVDGSLDEQLMALAFERHPYRWPTIGWMDDIRRVTLDEIRSFYRTWYAPNNACLVVVGDFDEQELLHLTAAAYGHLSAAELPREPLVQEPQQLDERSVRLPKPIATHRLLVGYKAPSLGHPDWIPLDIAATILAGCSSARLQRRLVIQEEVASSVDAQLTPFRDPSLLRIAITCARGHDADQVMQILDEELDALRAQPPSEVEVDKAKAVAETDLWSTLVDVDGKAEALGHHQTVLGDFRALMRHATELTAVTPDDVARVLRTYLVPAQRTVVIAEPTDSDDDADDDADDADEDADDADDADDGLGDAARDGVGRPVQPAGAAPRARPTPAAKASP
jgi:zinc protease